jgi:Asp-tRNA(Asn)/Glu-tRNA(Gln) amidotransferase B subunit
MSKVNSNDKNYYSIIMKSIQNEIKDFIIDKYLSIIMNQNIKIKELKIKSKNLEKLANKCLKKLLSHKEEKSLKKIQNSKEKKEDLNSSKDFNFSN